jgi:hypothetical protein
MAFGYVSQTPLSGSTNGQPVLVVATATLGTTVHTAGAGTTNTDHITNLWAANTSGGGVLLSVERGTATTTKLETFTIPANSSLQLPNLSLNNGQVLTMFAGSANVINITGKVTTTSS